MTIHRTENDTAYEPLASEGALRRLSLVVALGAIMTVLDTTIVNVAVQVLGREMDAPISTIQWVVTGYTLALSMTIPITGWATGRFGGRTLWLTSLVLFIAGSVLCGLAWSPASLIAFRIVQGVGGGLLMPVGQAMLARAAGPKRLGRAMAVVSVPAMLAPVLGPVLGGWLLDHVSWRWMFLINVPVCGMALLLALVLLPRGADRPGERRPLDTRGLLLLSPGLAALVYGLSAAGDSGRPDTRAVLGILGGTLLLGGFVLHALRRRDAALVDVRLFADRGFGASAAALCLYGVAMFGIVILLPLFDQIVLGGDTLEAGLLVAPLGAGAIITMLVAGRLTDRVGARVPTVLGLLVVLAGTAALTTIGAGTGPGVIAGMIFVIGLGHGLVTPSLMAAAYVRLSRAAIPAATALATVVVRVGSALGAAVGAIVLQLLAPSADDLLTVAGERLVPAFEGSFRFAAVVLAIAVLPALLLPKPSTVDGH
ncbi:MDR family MFS transporter [Virgisporangium aliadipatigenens]|uniref:MDR family MFS transporter n=1 Tax=Virgisporangium aliadipatigenens TaxID=741659 RepID=UPI001943F6C0|nr:MDR family MFS transporter [Virgisporangium aliadipatigenens]